MLIDMFNALRILMVFHSYDGIDFEQRIGMFQTLSLKLTKNEIPTVSAILVV